MHTDRRVINTISLLDRIHNGIGTKSLSYKDLRKLVYLEIAELISTIENYHNLTIKEGYGAIIKKKLSRTAPFTAFKRWHIRDDIKLAIIFEVLFD
jgi:hypothetical protein